LGLNRAAFENRVPPGERVLIDTSAFIAYFNHGEAIHNVAAMLIDEFVQGGRNEAVVSPVTVMELLVRPLRTRPKAAAHVHAFLTQTPNLVVIAADLHVAQDAAALRATHNFKAVDALVIATGIVGQVAHLITNDAEWRRKLAPMKRRIQVTELRDYVD
jgi:predicted nucleic acid-binding protein